MPPFDFSSGPVEHERLAGVEQLHAADDAVPPVHRALREERFDCVARNLRRHDFLTSGKQRAHFGCDQKPPPCRAEQIQRLLAQAVATKPRLSARTIKQAPRKLPVKTTHTLAAPRAVCLQNHFRVAARRAGQAGARQIVAQLVEIEDFAIECDPVAGILHRLMAR